MVVRTRLSHVRRTSPHPVLIARHTGVTAGYGDDHSVVRTLRRNEGGMRRLLVSAAEAHVHGKSPTGRYLRRLVGAADRIAHLRFPTKAVLDGP